MRIISSRQLFLWITTTATSTTTATAFHTPKFLQGVRFRHYSIRTSSLALTTSGSGSGSTGFSIAKHLRKNRSIDSRAFRSDLKSAASDTNTMPIEENLRVALCQFHVTGNKEENHETAQKFLKQAAEKGAQLVVLPEIWNSPYATAAFPDYAEIVPEIGHEVSKANPSSQILMEAAKNHEMWVVGGSIPEKAQENGEEKIYNTCLVFNPQGEIVAKHRKVHLFDIDVPGGITFFESETLSAGKTVSHFSSPFGEIGVGICYDIRFAEFAMLLKEKFNCNLLIYPGAFNMTTGPAHWELLQRARAIDNQCFVITASPARSLPPEDAATSKYPHYTAWGHSTVVSPWGDVLATTDEKEGLVVADLQLNKVVEVRKGIPIGSQKRTDLYQLKDPTV